MSIERGRWSRTATERHADGEVTVSRTEWLVIDDAMVERVAREMFEWFWIDAESVGHGFQRTWEDDDLSEAARNHWRREARAICTIALGQEQGDA